MRILTALIMLPLTLGFYNSFEEGSDLSEIAQNISAVVEVDPGQSFDLGENRTVGDALDSNLFRYSGKSF